MNTEYRLKSYTRDSDLARRIGQSRETTFQANFVDKFAEWEVLISFPHMSGQMKLLVSKVMNSSCNCIKIRLSRSILRVHDDVMPIHKHIVKHRRAEFSVEILITAFQYTRLLECHHIRKNPFGKTKCTISYLYRILCITPQRSTNVATFVQPLVQFQVCDIRVSVSFPSLVRHADPKYV